MRQQDSSTDTVPAIDAGGGGLGVTKLLHHPPAGLTAFWTGQSLATQFLQAGSVVALVALIIVGYVVTNAIEASVTRNTAAATALYVDSVIAPLLPDMRTEETLDESVALALDETLSQGALGRRLMSFRLWRRDGTILYSNDKELVGKRFDPNPKLQAAFGGQVVAEYEHARDVESQKERETGQPLLEIYNPVLQPWSGEVVAVSEFYELAPDFERSLARARLKSWLGVALATIVFFAALFAIVLRGSRLIDAQKEVLKERVTDLTTLLEQNEVLRLRVQRASQRVTALNEKYLRQIGSDLHDGPAQLIALAALKLDGRDLASAKARAGDRQAAIAGIRDHLRGALSEIRSLCRGLVLPRIETAGPDEIITLAIDEYRQRSGIQAKFARSGDCRALSTSEKICVYRFVQEGLTNGFRHASGNGQSVSLACHGQTLSLSVTDGGLGFDPGAVPADALGLAGLRDRVESLGGQFNIQTGATGTKLTMTLNEIGTT